MEELFPTPYGAEFQPQRFGQLRGGRQGDASLPGDEPAYLSGIDPGGFADCVVCIGSLSQGLPELLDDIQGWPLSGTGKNALHGRMLPVGSPGPSREAPARQSRSD